MTNNVNFNYQKEFDVLRAISVILVILFHLNEKVFYFGFIGVDIFFFISGYVITQSLFNYYNKKGDNNFLLNFYFRRIRRILPVLLTVLFFSLITFFLIVPYGDYQLLFAFKSFLFSIFGLSNIYYYKHIDDFDYFSNENTTPFLHTWSLGIEEQFYVIFPFILLIFFKLKIKKIFLKYFFLLMALVSLYLFINGGSFLGHYYLLPSRAWEILFGACFFLYNNKEKLKIKIPKFSIHFFITSLIFIFFLLFLIERNINYKHQILASIILLILFVNRKKHKNILFENYFIYLGKLSYSLYLWHFPLIYFLNYYFTGFLKYIFILGTTFILSYFSYNFIEIPMRKINFDLKKIRIFFVSLIGVPLLLVILNLNNIINIRNLIYHSIVNINSVFKELNITRKSIEYRISNKHFIDNDKCNNNNENFTRQNYLNCIIKKNNKNLFYLIGDSFGEHFLNVLTSPNSQIFDNVYLGRVENANFVDDKKLNYQSIDNFNKINKNFDNSYIIFSLSYQSNISIDKLINYFSKLKNQNIIIIKPHQRTNKFIYNCIESSHLKIFTSFINVKKCEYDKLLDKNRIDEVNKKLYKLAELFSNIKLFEFNNLVCGDKNCNLYDSKNNLIFFTDNTHLSYEFANVISPVFERWFKNEYFKDFQ